MPSSSQPALGGAERRPNDWLDRAAYHTGRAIGRARRQVARLPVPRPWMVLGLLVVCDWLVIVQGARIAVHQGWLYYDGGDGTWYYTSAWVLAHGHIPDAAIGYGYSLLIAPLTLIAGANALAGLPLVVVLNAVVLSPIALLCLYGLAKEIGGRGFGYATAAAWVIFPLAAIRYFLPDYHTRYVDVTLPALLGLTSTGDFPSTVCIIAAAYFTYRSLSSRSWLDALTAGVLMGLAVGIKPANALFVPGPFLALAFARRPRQLGLLAAGIAPSVIALTIWKYRGLGNLPLFSSQHLALAAGGGASVPPLASFSLHLTHYVNFSLSHYNSNLDGLREFGWSKRLAEWLAFGGLIGLARRSLTGATLVGLWFFAYLFIKGGDSLVSFDGGNVFTHLMPAIPAYVLLAMCTVFLVPVWGRRRLAAAATRSWPQSERARRGTLAVLGFCAVVPIGAFLLLPPLTQPAAADLGSLDLYAPANQFALTAQAVDGAVALHWTAQATHGAHASYFIFRSQIDPLTCTPIAHAASACELNIGQVAIVPARRTSYLDHPGKGPWTYRVALSATGMGPPSEANPLLLSVPATATVAG